VTAILALAVIAALSAPRLLTLRAHYTQPQPGATSPGTGPVIPDPDLAAARLAGLSGLVTPLQLAAQSGSHRVEVIGAYADAARTVVFFRTSAGLGAPLVSIDDEYGFLNSSSWGDFGAAGDYAYSLDTGPRRSVDGLAHLKVAVSGFDETASGGSVVGGDWTFLFKLKVQPPRPMTGVPATFRLGSWKVTLEVAESTPSVLHVQAVLDGASPEDVGPNTTSIFDPSGNLLPQLLSSAAVTVPKQNLTSSNYKLTRINDQWQRPAVAGEYQLRFLGGGGGAMTIRLSVTAPGVVDGSGKGGSWLKPTDFPSVPESLALTGSMAARITTGRPSRCGAGGTLFEFATYFQAGGAWYWLDVSTNVAGQEYRGTGTYKAPAWLYTVGPNGPDQVLYEGTVQLTLTTDRPPYQGSVEGTLTGLEIIAPESEVRLSGTWTCTPGPNVGKG
jgi:hypothetical protein